MTQEEKRKLQYNVAKFLGWEIKPDTNEECFTKQDSWDVLHISHFNLEDWNWIMEVVEAIEKLGYWVCIQNTYIGFGNKNDENAFLNYSFSSFRTTKKEAVVQAINQFLIWYENNK